MTTSLPPVTVAIAMYNEEAYIGDAIRSVLAQTHGDFEILVLDDGSTDASCDIVRSFDDPRIKLVSDGRNLHQAARHNQATDLAAHDFIARLDADDMMAPERLEKQVRFLVGNPDFDLVASGAYLIDCDGALLGLMPASREKIDLGELLNGAGGIIHPSIMFRRTWLTKYQYNAARKRNEDLDLWLRAFQDGNLALGKLEEPLIAYRTKNLIDRAVLISGYQADLDILDSLSLSRVEAIREGLKAKLKKNLVRVLPSGILRSIFLARRSRESCDEFLQERFLEDFASLRRASEE